jgi:DEAD/DEAH box helicase domain-containing protein
VVLVARDDPLDTYLVHHPGALLNKPIEAVVIDPTNPHVLRPHLLCAATELPLTEEDVHSLDATEAVSGLVDDGLLRKRPSGYFAAPGINPYAAVDIRGSIGGQIMILEADTGRVLGTVDTGRAPAAVHPGAVYLHSGETYLVDSLDFSDGIALVHSAIPDYSTFARSTIDIAITGEGERVHLGDIQIGLVPVDVTHQVIGYLRKLATGEILDFVELDMPSSTLSTKAVMYTVTPEALAGIDIDALTTPGALHAAEHAAIGLLPLVASCDRSDIGGVSTALQLETGLPTVFVYDGHPGGAGFAARGYQQLAIWLGATADAIEACECEAGCPSCVQSPKCGNGNSPLDKAAAVKVLRLVLSRLPG